MQLPDIDASSDVYLKHTDHFAGAVEGWSDAEVITAAQRTTVTETGTIVASAAMALRTSTTHRVGAAREATKVRARFGIRDILLDLRVQSVSDGVLNGPAMRDRTHPVFKRVFQDGPAGDITEMKMRDEPEAAELIRDRLITIDAFDGKDRLVADLSEAVSKSIATRDSLDDAEIVENKAGDVELQARLGVRMALDKAYGILRAVFPGQRKFVESFFYRAPRKSKKDDATSGTDSTGG